MPPFDPKPWLVLTQVITFLGLLIVIRTRAARDPSIGRPILVIHDSAGVKPALLAVQTALLIMVFVADAFPTMYAALALYGGLALTWLAPGASDRACGEEGVFRGWYGRRYEDLEEWRLTGDHLRFKLFSEWTSVELPAEKKAHVRAILLRVAPDRESPFKE